MVLGKGMLAMTYKAALIGLDGCLMVMVNL